MKAIPGEYQHAIVMADIDMGKIRKVVKKTCFERRNITAERCEEQEAI